MKFHIMKTKEILTGLVIFFLHPDLLWNSIVEHEFIWYPSLTT
jgi:hypothetical protein